MTDVTILIPIVFGLMLLVNIFTEVLKNTFKGIVPLNLLVLILSVIMTVSAMFIYLSVRDITFVWWMACIAVVIAFMVAYSAMFGFDKFKQMLDQWRNIKRN